MSDQPLVDDLSATVFKQYEIKWKEIGKAALIAGLTIPISLLLTSLNAGHWPEWIELKSSLLAGLGAAIAVASRDFFKPTITVIKGQTEPTVVIKQPDTVITTDIK